MNQDQHDFLEGAPWFGAPWEDFGRFAMQPVLTSAHRAAINPHAADAVYQTLLAADALRFLTLQMVASKGSGHPGGFASGAEVLASLFMLGVKNIATDLGHHAPGFYSALFLDDSLRAIGVDTVRQLVAAFREVGSLPGHVSGVTPGILSPAGPLGQGQHFAMAAATANPGTLFPITIGDGGVGEPYVMSSMLHFSTAFPATTNFLPVLIWNGYGQEHRSMVSEFTNSQMIRYWRSHGFHRVIVVDAVCFGDSNGETYGDSTRFPLSGRLSFTAAVLQGTADAACSAMSGTRTALIVKQLKGAGIHVTGAASHSVSDRALDRPYVAEALARLALPRRAWQVVRQNFSCAGGGPAGRVLVHRGRSQCFSVPQLRSTDHLIGSHVVPSSALADLIMQMGQGDPRFLVSSGDGTTASGMKAITDELGIRHPAIDPDCNQGPGGRVYEPLDEDACAGLAAALTLFGIRTVWLSYECFALNGWPIIQTVAQEMAVISRRVPSTVVFLTAGAMEQARNGPSHQRPEIAGYVTAMMRSGNVYALFPCDANALQMAYEYAVGTYNRAMIIFASKTALPIYLSLERARAAIDDGAVVVRETCAGKNVGRSQVVFAVVGDLILLSVMEAAERIEALGYRVRVVAVVNPRRLLRATDVAWQVTPDPDDRFMESAMFDLLFDADVLVGVSGGPSAPIESVMLRARAPVREILAWQRGTTAPSTADLMAHNGLSADAMVRCIARLCPL